jgi:nucleotide-binding universal stress UspA family protein
MQVTSRSGTYHRDQAYGELILQAMNGDLKRTPTNILHLTDFSPCSDAAFEWALDIAHAKGSTLSVLHVVVPDALTYLAPVPPAALDMQESWARQEMQRIDRRLAGVPHHTIVTRGSEVWMAAEKELEKIRGELIVLGTHGKTGLSKFLLGSIAERVLRSSPVPVMTVGPGVSPEQEREGKFHRVLLAANFAPGSATVAEYAINLAQRDQAQLVLLHTCKQGKQAKSQKFAELSVAEAFHRLHELIRDADMAWSNPETLVEFGDAGTRILEVAKQRRADLIVMGARNASSVLAASHLEIGTTHKVVAYAPCPVLTVGPMVRQAA